MAATQTFQTERFASQVSEQKPSVPVVTHVITDEDIGALQVILAILRNVFKCSQAPHLSFKLKVANSWVCTTLC